ncbi:MAG: fumarate hydratase [Bradyrhizobium sp.]|uniref:fumarate hydratase n=1 Tax=Bradyrhizobium sp. TaxID=376 RepID=UPI001C28B9A5|nr:fumarate hydratase [Bradyrhizobium sp.]MBU6462262.1 fumarate hydratase [Pseudomonadota bacterium]MDE2067315.1 fumarate hydratase [Bradyrhizobium sp.]
MNAPTAVPDQKPVPPYKHTPLFPLGADTTPYRKITAEGVRVEKVLGKDMLVVSREALRGLSEAAFGDINHYLRPGHLKQLRSILDDEEASDNDKFVAFDFLKNANVAAGGVLPMCQDTGTAIIMGKKGCNVITDGDDEAALSEGARDAYLRRNLRYSQVAPLSMYEEKNTANNMPAQCEIYAEGGSLETNLAYKFMFMAKGGGSANKSFLFQATPSVLTRDRLLAFLKEKVLTLGTAACPPYHLAIVIGGTSAELCMKTVKLASARYLDALSTHGSADGNAFRDLEMEQEILKMTQSLGVGAQFGGKYFCHDVRVIRMPRHGASLPIGLGVSCSADRQVLGKITRDGIYLEELEHNPAQYLPDVEQSLGGEVVKIDLNKPMKQILATLSKYPIKTRVSMTGTMIVARDSAHAKLRERLEKGEPLPDYFKNHPVYYAGPAKTPDGYASGAFGPTTAGRMDSFVDQFQAAGGSMVMVAKGNRAVAVREACKKHGGFYLGSIGGAAANLAEHCIKKVEVVEYPELGMEAIWRIEVMDFPAFVIIDDKGNDFFRELNLG